MQADYKWINIDEVRGISASRLFLFGAGQGSIEFFKFLRQTSSPCRIVGISDNDSSLWGSDFYGHVIIAPEKLLEQEFDLIVVTSVSGRESISLQLQSMGFEPHEDFELIGRFANCYVLNYQLLRDKLLSRFSLEGKTCLHIGPGGFLGLELMLSCLGCESVTAIDKFSFGIHYPDVTSQYDDYKCAVEEAVRAAGPERERQTRAKVEELLVVNGHSTTLNQRRIDYLCPLDIEDYSPANGGFDLVLSFAVLEHVASPERAVQRIAQAMKPGGWCLHRIMTRDHRSFSPVFGLDPFSYRKYSAQQWREITKRKFYQNRILPVEWKRLFEAEGLAIVDYQIEEQFPITDETRFSFHPDFHGFSNEALGQVNCSISAYKTK